MAAAHNTQALAGLDDRELAERLKARSPEAFEELVNRYGRRLYSVSLRMLRVPEDAEDAVQEALLKSFKSIDRFREQSSLYTWLYRIVCNQALMKLRSRKRGRVVPFESFQSRFEEGQYVDTIQDWTGLPDQVLETQELADFFETCVDELPENLRVAYILKDIESLSEERVCEILKITKPTMKNRVHRARLVIRKRIQDRFFPRKDESG